MKLSLPALLLIFFGAIILYSARMDRDPRNVIFEALGVKRRVPEPPKPTTGAGEAIGNLGDDIAQVPGLIGKPPTGTGPIVSV